MAAASERAGQLVTTAYSVAPAAIVVPPESPVRRPEDLAGVPIGVGYHSGSHFATVQALEAVLAPDEVKLTFQGPPNERLDALLGRQVPAATTWGVPLYVAEAFGFLKILDATFMIGFLVTGSGASQADVDKYLSALRRAQMEIDLRPELYKHYHLRAVPEKYRDQVDVRAFRTSCKFRTWPAISRPKTGSASAKPIQNRRVISRSSSFGAASAVACSGSSAMPQIGHEPGPGWRISGCIGQVKIVPRGGSGGFGGDGTRYWLGSATNFARQPALQKK